MKTCLRSLRVFLVGVLALGLVAPGTAEEFDIARIYIEYNSSGNDLGFHVFLDGEDWKTLQIINPNGAVIFEVNGRGPYEDLGLTELFFEGAEPSLDEVPLDELLPLFPEGQYRFVGTTVDGSPITAVGTLSHAVPAGPVVSARLRGGKLVIRWSGVTSPPEGFPDRDIEIVGYQVIVDSFQVTLPASARQVTVPREFVKSLEPGEHDFEVLAIEASGNQTITEGTFQLKRDRGDDDDDD